MCQHQHLRLAAGSGAAAPKAGLPVAICRFCLGSNKVLQVALGRTAAEEYQPQTSELASRIRGSVGLVFTRMPHEEVRGHATALCGRGVSVKLCMQETGCMLKSMYASALVRHPRLARACLHAHACLNTATHMDACANMPVPCATPQHAPACCSLLR